MTNHSADIYEALGRHDIAASLRRGDPTPTERHAAIVAGLQAEIDELKAELRHADEDMKQVVDNLCPTCREKRGAA